MNRYFKYLLIVGGLNIVSVLVFCLPVFFDHKGQYDALGWLVVAFIVTSISLFIQLIVGIFYITRKDKKELGQAMLTVTGIALLIGLSVCSVG